MRLPGATHLVVLAPRYVGPQLVSLIGDKLENWLGLEINREKTRVVNLREKGASLDFPGFTFRYYEELKELTGVSQTYLPLPELIRVLNRQLDGWANYFRFGYPREAFREINWYVRDRLKRHLRRRSQRPFRPPEGSSYYEHLNQMGLRYL